VPPVDDELLAKCRGIARQQFIDPDVQRLANDYLRKQQRKEDTP
jgi:hypothetical protein